MHLSVVAWKESGYEGSRPGKYFCLDKFFFFTLFGIKFRAVCTHPNCYDSLEHMSADVCLDLSLHCKNGFFKYMKPKEEVLLDFI